MNFYKTAIKRPVTTIMLMLIIVVMGAVCFTRLPLDLFPKMELPIALVMVQYPNSAPTEVETMITKPVEQQLATVQNLDTLSSVSMDGVALVIAQFENGTDMDFASLDMREAVDLIADYLPDSASKPMVITMNPDMMPVSSIYASGDMPLTELNQLVEDELIPALERAEGVASVSSFGGTENEVSVEINQERLSGYNLTLSQISQILAAENITLPSGDVNLGSREMIVRTVGEFSSVDELKQVPITLPTREIIYLQDLADINYREKEQTSIGRINESPAVGVSVTKQTVANTVAVSTAVNKAIEKLEAKHPELTITVSYDQADFIKDSVYNVAETAILGCILAVIVCFLFLRNIASTMIIAISIPTSIIATFILMYVTGLTMNVLSLSGLAVGIGMLVDDSIVVMENIYRRRDGGLPAYEASLNGTREVSMPVFTATMTKIAVFLPIVFVQGIAATIFKEFTYTIAFALLCSLLVALTVVPMLCSRLLNTKNISDTVTVGGKTYHFKILPGFERLINFITRKYVRFLRFCLHHRKSVIAVALALLVSSGALIGVVGGVLLPTTDEGSFTVSIELPYGTSLEDADKVMQEVETYVSNNIPEVVMYSADIGSTNMLSTSSENTSTLSVVLVDKGSRDRSTAEIVASASKDLKNISGAKITLAESSSMSMSTGSPISVAIKGDDLDLLRSISNDLVEVIQNIPGTTNVSNSMVDGNPEVQVHMNRHSAARYGITSYQLAQTLNAALTGVTSTTLKMDGTEIDIVLSLNGEYGDSVENMLQIGVLSGTGQSVTVGEIADIVYDNSPAQISREDQVRTATVSSNFYDRDLQSVSADVEAALAEYPMPSGYTYDLGGESEEMMESFTSLAYALLLAMLLVFMILASQFESLIQPFIIMLSIPFALTGAFLALFLTGTPLSLVAFLGIIMLAGVVVNNAILLIDFINQNQKIYESRDEAVINAGRFRLRPIFMTMLTTCLGLLPLSLGIGSGGELQAPMGITVIGGLLFSTLITLVIVPVIYVIIDDRRIKSRKKRERKRLRKMRKLGLTEETAVEKTGIEGTGEVQ